MRKSCRTNTHTHNIFWHFSHCQFPARLFNLLWFHANSISFFTPESSERRCHLVCGRFMSFSSHSASLSLQRRPQILLRRTQSWAEIQVRQDWEFFNFLLHSSILQPHQHHLHCFWGFSSTSYLSYRYEWEKNAWRVQSSRKMWEIVWSNFIRKLSISLRYIDLVYQLTLVESAQNKWRRLRRKENVFRYE